MMMDNLPTNKMVDIILTYEKCGQGKEKYSTKAMETFFFGK